MIMDKVYPVPSLPDAAAGRGLAFWQHDKAEEADLASDQRSIVQPLSPGGHGRRMSREKGL